MACEYYFSLILLGLSFITTLTAAAPASDCDIPADKAQAATLRDWVTGLAHAVNYAIETDSVISDLTKQCGALGQEKSEVIGVLDKVRIILTMQSMALLRPRVQPGNIGIPQGWLEALKSEQDVKDSEYLSQTPLFNVPFEPLTKLTTFLLPKFKKSMLAALFVKATGGNSHAGLDEGDAKSVAELSSESRCRVVLARNLLE
ncbi:hypothetical protein B9Z19DRAFT_1126601 [Tuber borchii]|uniref:Uncharacterized protein n=1 Tax=Tuber borchii TaxID=42251 RepID=A0A2T6ZSV4_TUBBO|nr:hypothetical protein B9Z19DRAFT_1126601 [Tuber borchii]